jgi:hypothetical protein
MRRLFFACSLAALLAGCAASPWSRDAERVSGELVRLSGVALATASSGEDMRPVLRQALGAGPRTVVVRVAGYRFLLAPATLETIPAGTGRYRWLLAQSLELAEQTCLPFVPPPGPWDAQAEADATGAVTLGSRAEQLQWVNVGIELREGCIVALHVEQASAMDRD